MPIRSVFANSVTFLWCLVDSMYALSPISIMYLLFFDGVKPRGCISWSLWLLRGINKTAWGTKLILTADLAYPVSCASVGHLLMAQHCHLCLNVCFRPPTAPNRPHHPPHPLPPPMHSIHDITAV